LQKSSGISKDEKDKNAFAYLFMKSSYRLQQDVTSTAATATATCRLRKQASPGLAPS
jgi:hypothetical protein